MKESKRESIKKPKFLPLFLITLASCLMVTSLASFFLLLEQKTWIDSKRREKYQERLNSVVEALKVYYETISHDKTVGEYIYGLDEQEALADLKAKLAYFRYNPDFEAYAKASARVYIEDDFYEIDTENVDYVGEELGWNFGWPANGPTTGVYYFVSDISAFSNMDKYEEGKYSFSKTVNNEIKYRYDPWGRAIFGQPDYHYVYDGLYINQDLMTCLPATIVVYEKHEGTDEENKVARITFPVPDSPDYVLIHYKWDLHPYTLVPYERDANWWHGEKEYVIEDDYGFWNVHYTAMKEKSLLELLPVTTWIVLGLISPICALILAVVIAVVLYSRKKMLWSIVEYERTTTERMAHDMKTPLATISAYSERLSDLIAKRNETKEQAGSEGGAVRSDGLSSDTDTNTTEEKIAEYTAGISENVFEMNAKLEKILHFSKMRNANVGSEKKLTDLGDLVKECVKKYQVLFEKKGINVAITGDSFSLNTDRETLLHAIDNLISNCAKYVEPNSEVKIEMSAEKLVFQNRTSQQIDNAEELKKPFVKGEQARGENGTGLGLAMADNDLKMLGYALRLSYENGMFGAAVILGKK